MFKKIIYICISFFIFLFMATVWDYRTLLFVLGLLYIFSYVKMDFNEFNNLNLVLISIGIASIILIATLILNPILYLIESIMIPKVLIILLEMIIVGIVLFICEVILKRYLSIFKTKI
ncbi:hypothetical protein [Bacillus cereus]|uniref:hypothetical protein n=1 Tax=Bacillus cereus TaxID=1396 RepID=UPI0005CECA55|nr:hypothetical protein [Bacillus cereus]